MQCYFLLNIKHGAQWRILRMCERGYPEGRGTEVPEVKLFVNKWLNFDGLEEKN